METILQSKVDQAVEQARRGGLEPLTVAQICEAVEQEKRRLTACFQQQVNKHIFSTPEIDLVRLGAEIAKGSRAGVVPTVETTIASF